VLLLDEIEKAQVDVFNVLLQFLDAREVSLQVTPEALDRLARLGHQREYGARHLRRTIQREIDNELSRRLLDGRVAPGQTVQVESVPTASSSRPPSSA